MLQGRSGRGCGGALDRVHVHGYHRTDIAGGAGPHGGSHTTKVHHRHKGQSYLKVMNNALLYWNTTRILPTWLCRWVIIKVVYIVSNISLKRYISYRI